MRLSIALVVLAGWAVGQTARAQVVADPSQIVGSLERIARLAIHAASTISLFYVDTWQRADRAAGSDRPTDAND